MKLTCLFTIFCLSIFSQSSFADTMSDKIIAAIIEKNLPDTLYQQDDIPWELGVYKLKITKIGKTLFASTANKLNISIPINASINGNLIQQLMGTEIKMTCFSQVITKVHIQITPTLQASGSTAKAVITAVIPPAELTCDGLKMPIKQALEQLIKTHKYQWEAKIETKLNEALLKAGI